MSVLIKADALEGIPGEIRYSTRGFLGKGTLVIEAHVQHDAWIVLDNDDLAAVNCQYLGCSFFILSDGRWKMVEWHDLTDDQRLRIRISDLHENSYTRWAGTHYCPGRYDNTEYYMLERELIALEGLNLKGGHNG